jgi:hypothetical protein
MRHCTLDLWHENALSNWHENPSGDVHPNTPMPLAFGLFSKNMHKSHPDVNTRFVQYGQTFPGSIGFFRARYDALRHQ